MGLFDKVKSNLDTTIEKGKEISGDLSEKTSELNDKRNERKQEKEQKKIDKILEVFNIFEGILVKATFPEEELVLKSRGGLAKGAATLGFGLVGLAATSGVKQKKQKKTIKTDLQVVDKGIVFKKATADGKDLRIPYDNIVKLSIATIKGLRGEKETDNLILTLLENQEIFIIPQRIKGKNYEILRNHLLQVINERARGSENEEAGWGLEYVNEDALLESSTPQIEENDSTYELEKIVDMYTKGLLTDEEFAAMKKKIIEK